MQLRMGQRLSTASEWPSKPGRHSSSRLACRSLRGPASAATLDRVRETGKLMLGYRADARPFSYKGGDRARLSGYSVALCEKVAAEVKAELGVAGTRASSGFQLTLEERFSAVAQGKIDLMCAVRHRDAGTTQAGVVFAADLSERNRSPSAGGRAGTVCRTCSQVARRSGPIWRGSPARILEGEDLLGGGRHDDRDLACRSSERLPARRQSRAGGQLCRWYHTGARSQLGCLLW